MILDSDFQSDYNNQQILPIDSIEFPYMCNYAELDNHIDKCFPWHWHPHLELNFIVRGVVELRTADETYTIKEGEVFFINADILHDIRAKNKMNGCQIYSHIFDITFLSGMYSSLFEQKYFRPIINNKDLQTYIVRPDTYRRLSIIEKVMKIVELNRQEGFGYEFEVRHELSLIWCMLLEETKDLHHSISRERALDMKRLKIMMHYIQEHYMDKISLDDIASSAFISPRECSRCFQRCTRLSPVNYLNHYRLRIAAQLLLKTDDNILTICESCGFHSSSYFGTVFRESFGCTPKDYRKERRR